MNAPRTNLVADRGPIVGRARDLAAIDAEFERGRALVTLRGPGGVGKTRLARAYAAARLASDPPAGGVWFCDLSAARTADDAVAVVADALALPAAEGPEPRATRVRRALAGRGTLLVVLDNCEQLVDAAGALVNGWLVAAPAAQILATSREALGLADEACYEVAPLALADASALFAARAHDAGAARGPGDAATIDAIVDALDRLPLAIELAAARTDVLSPRELLARLRAPGGEPGVAARGAHPRHATLRATIAWSWALLDARERRAFAQCAVFHGGFALPAAEAVLDVGDPAPVLDVVHALRARSLLHRVDAGGPDDDARLGLYATLAAFATEQLDATGERAACEARLADYLARTDPRRTSAGEPSFTSIAALRWLALERDNLVAAQRAATPRDATTAVVLALVLHPLLLLRGSASLHAAMLDDALATAPDDALRARLHLARGEARRTSPRSALAVADFASAVALGEATAQPVVVAHALRELARASHDQGLHDDAAGYAARALERARALGDPALEACAIVTRVQTSNRGERSDAAVAALEQGIALSLRAGDDREWARGLVRLPTFCLRWRTRLDAMGAMYATALDAVRRVGDRQYEAVVLMYAGHFAHQCGALDASVAQSTEALDLARTLGHPLCEVGALATLAGVAIERGRLDEASALLTQAAAAQHESGAAIFAGVLHHYTAWTALFAGRLAAAADAFDAAATHERHVGAPDFEAVALAAAAFVAAQRGAPDDARAFLVAARACAAQCPGDGETATVELVSLLADARLGDARDDALGARADALARDVATGRAHPVELRLALRLVADVRAATPWTPVPARAWSIGPEARWFAPPDGARVDLSRNGPLRRVLRRLAHERVAAPDHALSWLELLDAGWPGEKMSHDAGSARVRTTVARLRAMGLRAVLQTLDAGYLLASSVPLELHDA